MARDRLAAIRAQQAAADSQQQQQPQYSFPQQAQQQRYDDHGASRPSDDSYGRHADDYRQQPSSRGQAYEDPYASPYDRQQPSAGQGQPSSRAPLASGGAGRSRPNNPPPISAPTNQYANVPRSGFAHEPEPPRDFNPYEPQAYSPTSAQNPGQQPRGQRSQYTPVDPVRTRQRSISGGKLSPEQRETIQQASIPPPPPIPSQNLNDLRGRERTHSRPETRAAPSYKSYDTEYDDYKSSTTNLVPSGRSHADESYEMQKPRNNKGGAVNGGGAGGPQKKKKTVKRGDVQYEEMGEFFAEVSDLQDQLREANSSVQHIARLHQQLLSLPSADDPQAIALNQELTQTTASTRRLYNSLKSRILALDQGNAGLRALVPAGQSMYNLTMGDVNVRQTQVSALKERFKSAIQNYAEVERDNRNKNRARMERQVKIVNPDLSKQEVNEVVRQAEEGGSNTVFAQALQQSDGRRAYAARGALREVETRAAALARIETTLVELAQLFSDIAVLVEEQDVQIVAIEAKAVEATNDMEKGLDQTKKAVKSARSARKKRWICFVVILIILIVVAVVVVVEVVLPIIKKNNAQNNAANANNSARVTSTTASPTGAGAGATGTLNNIASSPSSSSVTAAPTSSPSQLSQSSTPTSGVLNTLPLTGSYAEGSGNAGFTARLLF